MDYSKLTKQELLDILTNQEVQKDKSGYFERQVEDLQKILEEKEKAIEYEKKATKDQIKARDEVIVKLRDLEDKNNQMQGQIEHLAYVKSQEIQNLEKSVKFIDGKYNDLAQLFEEYVLAFKEQIKLSEVMFKNNNYVLQALEIKIKKFNGSDSE
jgi:hypothetical protein